MTDWYPAPAILALRDEVNDKWPDRDKASDGIIGDPAHAARDSDHNPDADSIPPGVVRAIDLDSDGAPGELTDLVATVLKATIGDERVWYVIWNRKIYSRSQGWAARVYLGSNPHDKHVHTSLRGMDGISEQQAHDIAFDTSDWLTDKPATRLPAVRLHRVRDAARHPRKQWAPVNVRRVQRALRGRVSQAYAPEVTGIYDRATRQAVQRFQRSIGYAPGDASGLLDVRSGTALGKDRFRLEP